jgi:hypothetical protein
MGPDFHAGLKARLKLAFYITRMLSRLNKSQAKAREVNEAEAIDLAHL